MEHYRLTSKVILISRLLFKMCGEEQKNALRKIPVAMETICPSIAMETKVHIYSSGYFVHINKTTLTKYPKSKIVHRSLLRAD